MSSKSIKLIIGIILLVAAILLYVFGGFNYIVSLIIGIIGVAMIILSFTNANDEELNINDMEAKDTEMPKQSIEPEDLNDVSPDFPKPDEKAKSEEESIMDEDKRE